MRQPTFVESLRGRYLEAAATTGNFSGVVIAQLEWWLTPEDCTASLLALVIDNLALTSTASNSIKKEPPISPILPQPAALLSSCDSPIPHVPGIFDCVQRFRASQNVTTKEKRRGLPSPTCENAANALVDNTNAGDNDTTMKESFELGIITNTAWCIVSGLLGDARSVRVL